ncbi:lutropin subunit beta [Simochromis diagramma]|uniref:Gonadotropin subunit beta-2 n=4 Tax=Haplochromini TaxID=319058 RepID=A0A3Q2X492_HAPBU|nr:lutropin subunit beta [Haplochromis burtoni]XP_039890031.1 lutropin subunit beta [Simochromis diagramma]
MQLDAYRMMAQISRMLLALMLSLFVGASTFILSPAAAFQLPPCQLINQTVSLEKEGCPSCHPVETTICSGHCITKDPVIKIPFSNVYQHVCTYRDLYYKTFELPDCPPGVDPIVTYPVALNCHCGRCAMDTSDCTFESLQPDFCMNDIPFYY